MIRITSENQLLEAFRPLEQDEIEFPRTLTFPLGIRDYLAWEHPAGSRVYLVFEDPVSGKPLGIVFKSNPAGTGPGETSHGNMCEWCHAVRSGNGVTLLTATSSAKRRVGVYLCRDLSCKAKALAEPGIDDMPVIGLSPRERIARVVERMSLFSRRNLF